MKVKVKEKLIEYIKRYKYFLILALVICILFGGTFYSENTSVNIYYNNEKLELEHEIHVQDSKCFMHVEDITTEFKENTFYDNISAKLMVTSSSGFNSIAKSSGSAYVNGTNVYFDVIDVMSMFNKQVIQDNNNIYISDKNAVEGAVIKNRVELYDISSKRIITYLNKNSKVQVLFRDIEDESRLYVVFDNKYYGWVLNTNVTYEIDSNIQNTVIDKKIIVKCENKLESTTDINKADILVINMLRLSGVDKVSEIKYDIPDNLDSKKIYASINNGQKSANYDQDIISGMLSSANNRDKIITNISKYVNENKLGGVVVDFANFSNTYSKYFTQFIKELAAVMKNNNKGIIVNIPSYSYIDVQGISKSVDYVILQAYGKRTIASKVSGATSPIDYVNEWIKQAINKGVELNKVILEINTESVLWTERKGTVINAEMYSMDTAKEYIKKNDITTRLDENAKQNTFSYTKGITTYKMWIEDSYSIKNKLELINTTDLAGVSIYKSGSETKEIYSVIKEKLK